MLNFKNIVLTISSILLMLSVSAYADEKKTEDLQKTFDQLKTNFNKNQQSVSQSTQSIEKIDVEQKKFSELNIKLDECIAQNTKKLAAANENLKVLGEQQNTEDKDIKTQRSEFEEQSKNIDNELKRCNLLKLQLKEISDKTEQTRLNFQKQQLLRKEISVLSGLKKADFGLSAVDAIVSNLKKLLSLNMLIAIGFGLLFGWLLKRKNSDAPIEFEEHSSPTFRAVIRGIRRTAPLLLMLASVWLVIKFQFTDQQSIKETTGFAFILSLAFAVVRGVFFPDDSTNVDDKNIPHTRMLMLAFSTIIFSTIAFALNEESLGRFSNSSLLYFIWLGSMIVAAISFIYILKKSIQTLFNKTTKSFYLYIPILGMGILIITAILGYRNFSSILYFGLLLSMISLYLMYIMIRISSELFNSLDQGKIEWQSNLRRLMGVNQNNAFPGVIWLRILSFFAILFVGISALTRIWGGPQDHISSIKGVFQNGLKIGSSNFDVLSIIQALLIIVVALSLLPFIKNKLITGWIKHSNLSSGAKDATRTLVGYVIVIIAFLWALSVLGMNFQNLAIIAGALSVGIGFGLQNIINNFVSGLILLFERPIRRGDWIVVGSTEGYVGDISIRSTTIQTFDKADVIVPNSELISNQVTNWMLSSNIGRLIASVGVAYGSDTSKVIEILTKIADDHPEVISHNEAYPTRVFFLAFGDSSLNFELRCFIKTVDMRIKILSEINLAIDAAFRENNIEIPFPQRVVHMETM